MRHESKFSTRIRSGGQSTFVLVLNGLADLETKFSVVPDRLLDSIIDDALAAAVGSLNRSLPDGVSVDISAVDLAPIRDQLRREVADRLTEIGVVVNPNDPVITSIIARYAEILNGYFQTKLFRSKGTLGEAATTQGFALPMRSMTTKSFRGQILQKAGIRVKGGAVVAPRNRSLIRPVFPRPRCATY